jgi:hypothetical protein
VKKSSTAFRLFIVVLLNNSGLIPDHGCINAALLAID